MFSAILQQLDEYEENTSLILLSISRWWEILEDGILTIKSGI